MKHKTFQQSTKGDVSFALLNFSLWAFKAQFNWVPMLLTAELWYYALEKRNSRERRFKCMSPAMRCDSERTCSSNSANSSRALRDHLPINCSRIKVALQWLQRLISHTLRQVERKASSLSAEKMSRSVLWKRHTISTNKSSDFLFGSNVLLPSFGLALERMSSWRDRYRCNWKLCRRPKGPAASITIVRCSASLRSATFPFWVRTNQHRLRDNEAGAPQHARRWCARVHPKMTSRRLDLRGFSFSVSIPFPFARERRELVTGSISTPINRT